jgi:hypothetical protein
MSLKKQQNKKNRNENIRLEYAQMFFNEGLRDEVIFDRLGSKYFLDPGTIYRIVIEKDGKPEGDINQLNLFGNDSKEDSSEE